MISADAARRWSSCHFVRTPPSLPPHRPLCLRSSHASTVDRLHPGLEYETGWRQAAAPSTNDKSQDRYAPGNGPIVGASHEQGSYPIAR